MQRYINFQSEKFKTMKIKMTILKQKPIKNPFVSKINCSYYYSSTLFSSVPIHIQLDSIDIGSNSSLLGTKKYIKGK